MAIDYNKYGTLIIDNLEGGYFHPDMYAKDPGFFSGRGEKYNATIDKAYKQSGETMFGFDRKAGGELNTRAPMVKFWKLIDQYYTPHHAETTWWSEKGGKFRNGKASGIPSTVGTQLRQYAAQTMGEQYESLAKRYLTAEAKKIIESDPGLILQFFYACWNGSGRFKKFAEVVNNAIKKGTKDPGKLQDLVQAKRVEIYTAANHVQSKNVPALVNKVGGATGGGFPKWIIAAGVGAILLFIFLRK